LRPTRQDHAEDLPRSAERNRNQGRSVARRRTRARADRTARRLFHREKALPQHRLLFGHHAQGYGFPHDHVHSVVLGRPHRWLDLSVEGNDRGPAPEDRAPAPALYRCHAARLRADLAAEAARLIALQPLPFPYSAKMTAVASFIVTARRGRPWRARCRRGAPRAHSIRSP